MTPPTRRLDVISEPVGDELVIYDPEAEAAHALRPEVAVVWNMCDGSRGATRIAQESGLTLPTVERALAALRDTGLLENLPRYSRRDLIAVAGGVAAPLVYSVLIPTSAAAAVSNVSCFVNGPTTSPSGGPPGRARWVSRASVP